jgi:hypothetical protein
LWKVAGVVFRPAVFNGDVLAFDETHFAQLSASDVFGGRPARREVVIRNLIKDSSKLRRWAPLHLGSGSGESAIFALMPPHSAKSSFHFAGERHPVANW